MRDHISIGASPCEEPCVQLGEPDYAVRALAECRRFIDAIRAKLGNEPTGARLTIKRNQHDFGEYLDVVCYYDDERPSAREYAYDCESLAPERWTDTERLPTTRCERCDTRGPVNRDELCAKCIATMKDADDASLEELEAASDVLDRAQGKKGPSL